MTNTNTHLLLGSALAFALSGVALPLAAQQPGGQPVAWGQNVNATLSGNSITEACNGCGRSGAVSRQTLTAGDGYVEFSAGSVNEVFSVGIGSGPSNTQIENLEFALRFNGQGVVEVRENGKFVADARHDPNQRFRIAIEAGDVNYYKYHGNTRTRIHSTKQPATLQYPAKVEVLLLGAGTSVEQVVVAGASSGPRAAGGTGAGAAQKITWTNLNNAVVSGTLLQAGPDGGNAGAQSAETLTGDGYVEFTAVETDRMRAVGLDYQNTNNTLEDIDFAIVLRGNGSASGAVAEIREAGNYVGDTMYTAGMRFRIAIENGIVKYYKYENGTMTPIRGSDARVANFPVHVDAALYDPLATISDAVGARANRQ
ncbi:MAG: hypothetical protein RLZZ227_2333 [Pseudomonadota bacterium]|jgi:hypothetical protein